MPSPPVAPVPFAGRAGGLGAALPSERHARRSFWTVLERLTWLAVAAHAVFLAMFWALGVMPMVWVNLASMALHAAGGELLRRRRNASALAMVALEVVLHAVLATMTVGWDSGFHYYVIALLPPAIVHARLSGLRAWIAVPMLGLAYLGLDAWAHGHSPLHPLAPDVLALLRVFNIACMFGVLGFLTLSFFHMMAAAEQSLRVAATTDPLTGLYNRRRLTEIATYEAARRAPQAGALPSVLLCDIDHFKRINDTHGHDVGDQALKAVGALLRSTVREHDSVARWGGEEFLALLPATGQEAALQTAERMRAAVARLELTIEGRPLPIRLTIGVATLRVGEAFERCVARADEALYRGKARGRDRVEGEEAASGSRLQTV